MQKKHEWRKNKINLKIFKIKFVCSSKKRSKTKERIIAGFTRHFCITRSVCVFVSVNKRIEKQQEIDLFVLFFWMRPTALAIIQYYWLFFGNNELLEKSQLKYPAAYLHFANFVNVLEISHLFIYFVFCFVCCYFQLFIWSEIIIEKREKSKQY